MIALIAVRSRPVPRLPSFHVLRLLPPAMALYVCLRGWCRLVWCLTPGSKDDAVRNLEAGLDHLQHQLELALTDRCGTAAGGGWLVWELCVRWGDSAHRRPVFTPSFTPHLQLCTPPPGQVPGG